MHSNKYIIGAVQGEIYNFLVTNVHLSKWILNLTIIYFFFLDDCLFMYTQAPGTQPTSLFIYCKMNDKKEYKKIDHR